MHQPQILFYNIGTRRDSIIFPLRKKHRWSILEKIISPLLSLQPTLWILAWGVSDMLLRPGASLPCASLQEFGSNLRKLVEAIGRQDPQGNIIIVSPHPVDRERWQLHRLGCGDSETDFDFVPYESCVGYIKECIHVSFLHNIPALDLFLRIGTRDWRTLLCEDGCHFNDRGNDEMYKGLIGIIDSLFPLWNASNIVNDVEFNPLRRAPQIRELVGEEGEDTT